MKTNIIWRILLRLYVRTFLWVSDLIPRKNGPGSSSLIKDLRRKIFALAPMPADAGNAWSGFRKEFRKSVLSQDLRTFLRWRIIRYTMFCDPPLAELLYLRAQRTWSFWMACLKESHVGSPPRYPFYPSSSGNLVHQAYNLSQIFDREMNHSFANVTRIVEFGGGYGCTCRLAFKMGFRGQYLIYDLPEFGYLQEFYLKSHGLPAVSNPEHADRNAIILTSSLDDLAVHLGHDSGDYLVIGTWSLSEAPLEIRASFLDVVRDPRYMLFAYQQVFSNINNRDYFNSLERLRAGYAFNHYSISHLPNNWYLTAERKDNKRA